ncbi:unnamed protein product [Ceutorhynchus assimilis]|uniref:Uncharacterized protein n=1 Tax=Ceutorhynchus assimilis TaxID=467358 RepID=A0A9N9QJM7_9CUCU|nr:unnamed protein product [Ceutorhynchus assimilis]
MKTFVLFVFFQIIICLAYCYDSTEYSTGNNECNDPNAELRYDNSNCTVTCNKRTLSDNPDSCFGLIELTLSCYCKNTFVLDETTNTCVQPENCPCNTSNNEVSRYSNNCANGCATFHTLIDCSGVLHGGCWCMPTFCTDANGICIEKE